MHNLEYYCKEVQKIARDTGCFLREERKRFQGDRIEEKSAHNYVTYVDKESERRLVEQLSALLPASGFIAEEGSASFDEQEFCWVIDPLDGTTNYIHDVSPYCVSIALRNQSEILLGVVYEIKQDECFYAYKGGAAFMNEQEIQVSPVDQLDKAFIGLGFPYSFDSYKPKAQYLIENLYGKAGGIRVFGAAAIELCYIAAGRFDARIEADLGAWDVAAGSIILQQAGGCISDFTGGDNWVSGKETLASNSKIHADLLDITKNIQ